MPYSIYEHISDKVFEQIFTHLTKKLTTNSILTFPGVIDIVREEINNDILNHWKNKQEWEWREFSPGNPLGEGAEFFQGDFRLRITVSVKQDRHPQINLDYVFWDLSGPEDEVIFMGNDFGASPLHTPISLYSVESLLGFFSCQKGDTDDEYFEKYSKRQLEWVEEKGEELALIVSDLSELIY